MSDPLEDLRDRGVLSWDSLSHADLVEVAELSAGIEHVDDTIERHSLDDVRALVEATGTPLEQIGVVGRDQQGSIVAYALILVRPKDRNPRTVKLRGGVHPAWRDKHIGSALVEWQIAAARRWDQATRRTHHGPLALAATVDASMTSVRDLYARFGLEPETWYLDAHRTFRADAPPQQPQVPDGVRLCTYTDVPDDKVRAAHNETFARSPGASAIGPAQWHESMHREGSMPELSWVITAGDRVIGYALNSVMGSLDDGTAEGWTDRLSVVPAWRGRGLSALLLEASAATFFAAGLPGAGIGFDSDDPLSDLARYRGLGYDTIDAVVRHTLIVT